MFCRLKSKENMVKKLGYASNLYETSNKKVTGPVKPLTKKPVLGKSTMGKRSSPRYFCICLLVKDTILGQFSTFIALCIYPYVITLGLRSKCDVDGHYFTFALFISTVPSHQRIQNDVTAAMLHTVFVFRMQTFNYTLVCSFALD